jgi:TrpR-related protein YerC/YecD
MGKNESIIELYKIIASLETIEEVDELLEDLCTYKEIEQMSQRIKAAKLLLEGDTYEEVISKTNISSATLSRVSKCVKYGKGYKKFIKIDNR